MNITPQQIDKLILFVDRRYGVKVQDDLSLFDSTIEQKDGGTCLTYLFDPEFNNKSTIHHISLMLCTGSISYIVRDENSAIQHLWTTEGKYVEKIIQY